MADVNRTGRVSSIDYAAGTFEVTYFDRGKSVTHKINAVSNGEYRMPKIGQMVSVCHLSNGTSAAVAIGTVWNKSNRPAEGFEGLYRKEYAAKAGQAYERYDANTGIYTQYTDSRSGRVCNGDIRDEAKKNISLAAEKKLGLAAEESMSLESAGELAAEAAGEMSFFCTGKMTVSAKKGAEISIEGEDAVIIANGVKIVISPSGQVNMELPDKLTVSAKEIDFSAQKGKITIAGRTL